MLINLDHFWRVIASIPRGKVMTYKQVAEATGIANPRLVGRYLHQNESPEKYPCHRVIRSDGRVASGYAFGGPAIQEMMLAAEGVKFHRHKVNLNRYQLSK